MVTNKQLLEKIDSRLDTIEKRLSRIEEDEHTELEASQHLQESEDAGLEQLKKLEELEEEIERDVAARPLARITYHDLTKGIIGSFFGIVGHFAFFYGGRIALDLGLWRAHALLVTSFIILILFLYFSGFRKVSKEHKRRFLAYRVLLIYVVAHAVIALVLFLFGQITSAMSAIEIYKNIATVSILAVMGAATADLIGGE